MEIRIMRIIIYLEMTACGAMPPGEPWRAGDWLLEMVNVDQQPDARRHPCASRISPLPVVIAGELRWSGFRPDMINRLRPSFTAASA